MNMWLHAYLYPWPESLLRCFAPWMPLYRGTGVLFYRPLYELFGLNPYPFHFVLILLLSANLFVWYRVAKTLGGSTAALVGCFAVSYWPTMSVIYYGLHSL